MLSKTIPISMYVYHCVLGVVDGCTCTYKDLYTRTFFSTCSFFVFLKEKKNNDIVRATPLGRR